MVSLADEVEVPSDEESTSNHSHMKDSSNDSDPYEDSSNDEGSFRFAWGSDSEEARPSHKQRKSGSSRAEASHGVDESVSNAESQDPEARRTPDELLLMEMSEEEKIFYEEKKAPVTDDVSLKCTKCTNQLFLSNAENIRIHPALGVLICKSCHEFYSMGGPFVQDSNGIDEHCRWCAEGGQIICCDNCPHVFCKACLRKCLSRDELYEIQQPGFKWSCLSCNKQPIWLQRALCRNVFMTIQKEKLRSGRPLRRRPAASNSSDPSVWLPAIITEAEELSKYCKAEARKAQNLWLKEVAAQTNGGSTSTEEDVKKKVIDCCRKLRKAVTTTRFGMKLLEKQMTTRYGQVYGNVEEINVKPQIASSSASASAGDTPKDKRIPLLKIKNFRSPDDGTAKRKNDFYAEIRGGSPQVPSGTTNQSKARPKSQCSSLVEESCGGGDNEFFDAFSEMPDENPNVKTEVVEDPLITKSVNDDPDMFEGLELDPLMDEETPEPVKFKQEMEAVPSRRESKLAKPRRSVNNSSRSERKPKSITDPKEDVDENEAARRALLESDDDGDTSDSSDEIFQRVKAAPSKDSSAGAPPTLDDPKLKAKCEVLVNRLSKAEEEGKLPKQKKTHLMSKIRLSEKKDSKAASSDAGSDDEDGSGSVVLSSKPKSKKPPSARKPSPIEDSDSSDLEDESRDISKLNATPKAPEVIDQEEAARLTLMASSSSEAETDEESPHQDKSTKEKAIVKPTDSGAGNGETVAILIDDSEDIQEMEPDKMEAIQLLKTKIKLSEPATTSASKKESEEEDQKKKTEKKAGKEKKAKKLRIKSDSDSDFQTETESEKPKKRKKGKQSTSDQDDSEAESKPKRRRRIKKTAASSSDGDSDDSDIQVLNESQKSEAGASKGRKNIKKIIKDQNLKEETKAAAKEEEARRKRILERQKNYNEAFVGDLAIMNARIDHLVLDFDPETKEELVTVHKDIVKQLKPHQVKGIKFMWDACFESVERLKTHPGSGCILAHCMGLGKSLQVVTLAHTVLTHEICQVNRVLVVCPLSTVLNWVNEFQRWLPDDLALEVYELTNTKTMDLRAYTLRNWMESGGVLVMGYDMYRNLCNETNKTNKKIKTKIRETFQSALVNPGPDLVVCDEGHMLKNESTALSKTMNRIRTQRRIVLTGTPLQNRLDEYHCMIQFVKPNLLGTKKEFTNRFANPIKNGQAADSTDSDVRVMKRRAHVLHKMLEGSVQRFDYSVLTPFLPPKHEFVISVRMSDVQIQMYQHYLENYAKGGPSNAGMRGKGAGLFADFQELGRVWTHPKALLMAQINRDLKAIALSDEEDLNDFIADDRSTPVSDDGVVLLDESEDEKEPESNERNGWRSRTRAGRGDAPPPEDELGVTAPINGSWWSSFVTDDDMAKIEHSGKLVLLMDILRQCELIGDKVLVFSQSLVSLDLIEEFLVLEEKKNEEARAALSQTSSGKIEQAVVWRKNADYFRLDGSTNSDLRSSWTKSFNNPENLRSRLFLISTKAGGLGINLTAANRVIIFDASWNPSHDVQSIFRVYRFGQLKPCYVYRFLAQGTMEEKIYDRQVTKLSLACRVVDEQQIERHFNSADLNELYIFEPDSHLRRPTPMVPKDRLLAELTIQRKDWIVTYHEHDSLLENKSDEELTEAERKAAWDDFENEKRGVPNVMAHDPSGYLGGGLMPGMPDILGSLAGRSVAGIPLSSIAAMIYNSNPGITQDEFLGRLRLTVDQLQNFSVQQVAAAAAAAAPPPPAPNPVQQQVDAQRMLMQRQMASEQMKRQFGNGASQPTSAAGPSGITPRARGRPPIGPHQRTDLYGVGPVLAAQKPPGGSPAVPNPELNPSPKM